MFYITPWEKTDESCIDLTVVSMIGPGVMTTGHASFVASKEVEGAK